MTCCGKGKQVLNKGKNIAKGFTASALGIAYEFSSVRVSICRSCEYNTWMKQSEYALWLIKHGIDVLKNFDDLTKLPLLPKQATGRTIYCRLCKCCIPKKADVEDERCPKNKWQLPKNAKE
jgi:hypothetical protein